jgi:hypothetical protein
MPRPVTAKQRGSRAVVPIDPREQRSGKNRGVSPEKNGMSVASVRQH